MEAAGLSGYFLGGKHRSGDGKRSAEDVHSHSRGCDDIHEQGCTTSLAHADLHLQDGFSYDAQ